MPERYDQLGIGYSRRRRPDNRIFHRINVALGSANSILNVGAGTGSYEPIHIPTVAVEPSFEMIRQRRNRLNVVQGVAEALPFADGYFDVSLAVLTVHHWSDYREGLSECSRVTRRRVVILTWDPATTGFWLTQDYFREIIEVDRRIFPSMETFRNCFGKISVSKVLIPADCVDGFLGAYWQRPTAYLDDTVRSGMSSFSRVQAPDDGFKRLQADLDTGVWRRRHRDLLYRTSLDLGYRLVTTELT